MTTSATSSTATSLPTRKPERRPDSGRPAEKPFSAAGSFFDPRPCGSRKFAVIPRPSEREARFAPNRSTTFLKNGAIAQLGERFNGIEEVVGSIPSGSTNNIKNLIRSA